MAGGRPLGPASPALAASGLSPPPRFTLRVTAATASPASSRGRVRPSHCGASSRGGAPPCCSASTKVNACSHLWLSWAGGTLVGEIKYCVTQRCEKVKCSCRVCPCASVTFNTKHMSTSAHSRLQYVSLLTEGILYCVFFLSKCVAASAVRGGGVCASWVFICLN